MIHQLQEQSEFFLFFHTVIIGGGLPLTIVLDLDLGAEETAEEVG